jgi:hypothetical protein
MIQLPPHFCIQNAPLFLCEINILFHKANELLIIRSLFALGLKEV